MACPEPASSRSGFFLELDKEFGLASAEFVAERVEIEVGLLYLCEQLLFLLLDVVGDVLPEHFDLGIEELVRCGAFGDLGDQFLGAGVFDFGLIKQVVAFIVFQRVAGGRIEDLFLDGRVDGELGSDFLGELLAQIILPILVDQLLIGLE